MKKARKASVSSPSGEATPARRPLTGKHFRGLRQLRRKKRPSFKSKSEAVCHSLHELAASKQKNAMPHPGNKPGDHKKHNKRRPQKKLLTPLLRKKNAKHTFLRKKNGKTISGANNK